MFNYILSFTGGLFPTVHENHMKNVSIKASYISTIKLNQRQNLNLKKNHNSQMRMKKVLNFFLIFHYLYFLYFVTGITRINLISIFPSRNLQIKACQLYLTLDNKKMKYVFDKNHI